MIESFIGKVNMKRLILSVIAMFVFIFASAFVIHSLLLGQTYKELAHLWRPEAELVSFMPWMMLGQLLIAKFYVLLFVRGYEGKGITEGLRFGLVFIGPYSVAPFLIQYAVIPHLPVQWRCARRRWPDVRGHRGVRTEAVAGRTGGRTSDEAVSSSSCPQGVYTQAGQVGANETAGDSDD